MNIFGKMAAFTKEISSTELDTGMVFGKTRNKSIREVTEWTRRKAWEYTNGWENKYTRDSLGMTSGKATVSSTN